MKLPSYLLSLSFLKNSACGLSCLAVRSCFASTSFLEGTRVCVSQLSNFVTGYQSPKLPGNFHIKVCGPVMLNPPTQWQWSLVARMGVGGGGFRYPFGVGDFGGWSVVVVH